MAKSKSTSTATEAQDAPASEATEDKVTILGRLTANPKKITTSTGTPMASFRVAVNPPEGDATFHNVVVFFAAAKNVCQYKRKGHAVEVVGVLRQHTYQDRDGNERQSEEIIASSVEFLTRSEFAAKKGQQQPERELAA